MRQWSRRYLLNPVEVAAVALLTGGAVLATIVALGETVPSPEAVPLRAAYGPSRFSTHGEEWMIRDFFNDMRNGFFVDVGANHYQKNSNTYYLETTLGWEGIAVEPILEFEREYRQYRPRTRFRPFFVSDTSDEEVDFFFLSNQSRMSSGSQDFTDQFGDGAQTLTVPTITLDDLLDNEGVTNVDFVSMDIELWEPRALAGFDIQRFRPALVCIEAHGEVRQAILDYFFSQGYVIVGKYLRADAWNLYFTPGTQATR